MSSPFCYRPGESVKNYAKYKNRLAGPWVCSGAPSVVMQYNSWGSPWISRQAPSLARCSLLEGMRLDGTPGVEAALHKPGSVSSPRRLSRAPHTHPTHPRRQTVQSTTKRPHFYQLWKTTPLSGPVTASHQCLGVSGWSHITHASYSFVSSLQKPSVLPKRLF